MALTRIPSSGLEGNITLGNVVISGSITNNLGEVFVAGAGSTGYTGSSGSGYTGSAGAAGSAGDTGYTGSAGADGVIGYNGSVGYTGSQGDTGLIGYTGSASTAPGYTGSAGADGIIGYNGSIGFTGSQGYTGSIGYTGSASTAPGYTGSAGADGIIGVDGYTGSVGYTGSIGYTGSASTEIGYTGSAGVDGIIGVDGYTGSVGYTGSASTEAGYTGSQGLIGYTGSAGTGGSGSGSVTYYATRSYTGDGTQTEFTVTSGMTGNSVIVTENGVVQAPGSDYSISSSTLTFTTAPENDVQIQIREMSASSADPTGNSIYSRTAITATAGQTSFDVVYNIGFLEVYFNGILLNSTDYTATTGSTVVLTDAAVAGDLVEFITYNIVPVASVPVATFNSTNLTSNLAITTGYSAVSVGPLTVADGVTISIAAGQKWVIL